VHPGFGELLWFEMLRCLARARHEAHCTIVDWQASVILTASGANPRNASCERRTARLHDATTALMQGHSKTL